MLRESPIFHAQRNPMSPIFHAQRNPVSDVKEPYIYTYTHKCLLVGINALFLLLQWKCKEPYISFSERDLCLKKRPKSHVKEPNIYLHIRTGVCWHTKRPIFHAKRPMSDVKEAYLHIQIRTVVCW